MLETIPDDLHRALEDLVEAFPNGATHLPSEVKGRLRRSFGREQMEWLWSVLNLQSKARKKLGDGIWWVSDRSLQQATAWQVSHLKSNWLLANPTEGPVVDLCCGCGGDTLAMAKRIDLDHGGDQIRPITAVDRDPYVLAMLRRNLESQNLAGRVELSRRSAEDLASETWDRIHVDPDRRTASQRVTDPASGSPAWQHVVTWAKRASGAVIKLAPAAKLNDEDEGCFGESAAQRVWISLAGQVREQDVLFGTAITKSFPNTSTQSQATPGGGVPACGAQRSAVMLRMNGGGVEFHASTSPDDDERVGPRHPGESIREGDWMVDPDAAIRAAGLTQSFANQHGLWIPGAPSGFLVGSSDNLRSELSGYGVVGRVRWVGSADDRKLRKAMRDQKVFPSVIKVRGTDHDPAKLTKRYRECGDHEITLWISRGSTRVYAVMTEGNTDEPGCSK